MIHFFLLIQICPDHGKPLLFGHERVVIGNVRYRRRSVRQLLETMVQKEMGNDFRGHMAVVSGMGCHDMSQDMNRDLNRLALGSEEVKPKQDEAEQGLCITGTDGSLFPISRGSPLEEIPLWLEIFIFGIGA